MEATASRTLILPGLFLCNEFELSGKDLGELLLENIQRKVREDFYEINL